MQINIVHPRTSMSDKEIIMVEVEAGKIRVKSDFMNYYHLNNDKSHKKPQKPNPKNNDFTTLHKSHCSRNISLFPIIDIKIQITCR